MNVPFIASTYPSCTQALPTKIQIDPTNEKQLFVQFEVRLPNECTVNDGHIVIEHVTESQTSLNLMVIKVEGIVIDQGIVVSCDNVPSSYQIISKDDKKPELDCNTIINHTTIIDNSTNYTCNFAVECINFNATKNSPKWINGNTVLTERKQRLFCKDVNQTTNYISCECDFPTHIYSSDEWVISNITFGSKYVSNSLQYEILQMTQQSLWNNNSLATFMFTIKEYDELETTDWIFHLVTDAYPCKQTNWTQWSVCDAIPVGIGHSYRTHIGVHGLPGQQLSCNQLKQHKECVVNIDKTISFSSTQIRVKEGDDGVIITARLNHELTANHTRNKSILTFEELNSLKGYDVIIYFEIPQFYQKEIVIDPKFIGWYSNKWDIVHEIKITALDDSNIDSLEQTISVSSKIFSTDTEYNELSLNPLTIIVEDNEKCRYCGIGNIDPFHPSPKPPFWDFKSIVILVAFLLMILFLLWRGYKLFKERYGVNDDGYDKLQQDGLLTDTISTK